MSAPSRLVGSVLLLAALLAACGGDRDPRLLTPATTFRHYRQALTAGDADAAWACLASGSRQRTYAGSADTFATFLHSADGQLLARDVARLEIVDEVEINARVGYLQFDASTVTAGEPPFYYFLHEPAGWRITTHTDSLFRAELEGAVARGELPLAGHG